MKNYLSFSEVLEIKQLFESGMTIGQLAEHFAVNPSTIHRQINAIYSKEELKEVKENRKNIYKNQGIKEEIYEIKNLLIEVKMLLLESKIKSHL